MNGKERISIGDLAKGTGTKVVTVRYYEQIGKHLMNPSGV
jgi:DNA-binding transcriptional MerR regulator